MDERPCSDERWEDLLAPPSLHPDYRPTPLDAGWRASFRRRGRRLLFLAWLVLCVAVLVVYATAGRAWW